MSDNDRALSILEMTTRIVSAYVSNNNARVEDIPGLIRDIQGTLQGLGTPVVENEHLAPAVPVKKSITPDYLVCLEDGKKLKLLRRYIMTNYKMTPEEYRAKWGLPADYPMVAPNYAARRSALARDIGLGTRRNSK